jgi:hypothetical protein
VIAQVYGLFHSHRSVFNPLLMKETLRLSAAMNVLFIGLKSGGSSLHELPKVGGYVGFGGCAFRSRTQPKYQ